MKFGKNTLLFFMVLIFATAVLAGGSIFGGHKHRAKNTDGVHSIGVHICGNLTCPDVVIREGSCEGLEHTTKQYGVCLCEDGYHVTGDKCVADETPVEPADEEPVTPDDPVIPDDPQPIDPDEQIPPCPEHASCSGDEITCETGYYLKDNECLTCPEHATACDKDGKATDCEENYTLK